MQIVIAGSGDSEAALRARVSDAALGNVSFTGNLPREEYRSLLAGCDVGIAVTVPGVSIPSFPSKIGEYCGAGLPVIACLEASTDAGTVIVEAGAGLSVAAGDPVALAAALSSVETEKRNGKLINRGQRARELYERSFSVEGAVRALVGVIEPGAGYDVTD